MALPAPATVTGAIVPGVCDAPTTPTYTIVVSPLLTQEALRVPAAARYVDLWLSDRDLEYGSGAPVIAMRPADAIDYGIPNVVRDYSTGVFVPPYPALVAPFSGRDNALQGAATYLLTTSVACDAVIVQFLLEL